MVNKNKNVDSIVSNNIGLVDWVISNLLHYKDTSILDVDDHRSAGYIGLITAAKKWDRIRPFSPYAISHIFGEIRHQIAKAHNIIIVPAYPNATQKSNTDIETRIIIFDVIESLPSRHKDIIIRHYIDGIPITKIAKDLYMSTGYCYKLLNESIDFLRWKIKKSNSIDGKYLKKPKLSIKNTNVVSVDINKEIIRMKKEENRSFKYISDIFKIPIGTVKSKISRDSKIKTKKTEV